MKLLFWKEPTALRVQAAGQHHTAGWKGVTGAVLLRPIPDNLSLSPTQQPKHCLEPSAPQLPLRPTGTARLQRPLTPGLRHSTLPSSYLAAAPPLPCPRLPQPRGTATLTPTSPTPVCTIFRPSSASSSAFTCSVDGEQMVRGVLPLHPRDPPKRQSQGIPLTAAHPTPAPQFSQGHWDVRWEPPPPSPWEGAPHN